MGVSMIRTWLKVTTIIAAGLTIASCGKNPFEKDPLVDQPQWVKDAVPGARKVDRELGEKDWVINADNGASYFAFAEGVESQATVNATMLVGGYTWEVFVENKDDFKDSKFEPNGKDWVFTWKPPLNIVPSTAPLEMKLRVVIAAKDANQRVVLQKAKEIPVFVTANRGSPVIVRDELFPTGNVREGESRSYNLYVRDTDPVVSSAVAPQIRFEPAISGSSFGAVDVAAFLTVGRTTQDPSDPAVWKYQITIDLTGKNLTATTTNAVFRLRAISRSNIASAPRDYSFPVITGVSRPESDFYSGDKITVKRGNKLSKIISFWDPNVKGGMSAVLETITLPAGLDVKCTPNTSAPWMAKCEFTWDVPATFVPASYRVTLKATNSSQAPGDNRKMDNKVEVQIEVTP